jgi:hypothetical protein
MRTCKLTRMVKRIAGALGMIGLEMATCLSRAHMLTPNFESSDAERK